MKKVYLFIAALCCAMTVSAADGALKGKFTINGDGGQIVFSKGNLQYQASTDEWRFAGEQWNFVGDEFEGNVRTWPDRYYNERISSTYDGWIDLFGWGTSGWHSGAKAYHPYDTSKVSSDYFHEGQLYYSYANADWGVYNSSVIMNGGHQNGRWRTLKEAEMQYLVFNRPNAGNLRTKATVNNEPGLLLLPDNWSTPAGISYHPGSTEFTDNIYTVSEWRKMEAAGAVFLPCAGYRYGTCIYGVYERWPRGFYWTSNCTHMGIVEVDEWHNDTTYYPKHLYFGKNSDGPFLEISKTISSTGASVRLVTSTPGEGAINGQFSIADGVKIYFSQGNLQYQASTKSWRFAEHQYDYVGGYDCAGGINHGNVYEYEPKCNNEQISDAYEGYIDLFGWGTSGFGNKHPWMTSTNNGDYAASGDIAGTYYDWGQYVQIENYGNTKGEWRTLTFDEWMYLINERPNASQLKGGAVIDEYYGYVLLPDDWELPDERWFEPGVATNTYTSGQWVKMRDAGAVFLPCGGMRKETTIWHPNAVGIYWTASQDTDDASKARSVYIYGQYIMENSNERSNGLSVRLVRDAESSEGIEEVSGNSGAADVRKAVIDGKVYILRNGKTYTVQGQEIMNNE